MENYIPFLFPVFFIVFGGGLIFILSRKKKGAQDTKEVPREPELAERFYMGSYVGGLPDTRESAPFVYSAITEDCFVFCRGSQGAEIGRIPRDSINQIIVDNKSQIAQRLTSREGLDKLKLDASSKTKSSCLLIDWNGVQGVQYNSLFEFTDQNFEKTAQHAAITLKKWAKQNVSHSFPKIASSV